MNQYEVTFEKRALKDLKQLKKSGRKTDSERADLFIEEVKARPRSGSGDPERLRHHAEETWSRRVNRKDRFVYEIFEDSIVIEVEQALGHYGDR